MTYGVKKEDRVRLIGRDGAMTVVEVMEEGTKANCSWFDEHGNLCRDVFDVARLLIVEG